jgi:CHASE2 domain-containing sensor protein
MGCGSGEAVVGKLVILKLGTGTPEQGFSATLQIAEEGKSPSVEITGRLPAAPEITRCYGNWASAYRSLGLRSRLEAAATQVTNVSKLQDCSGAAQELRSRLNAWLASESFRPIREKLLEQLMPTEEIRLLVQAENPGLRQLPWYLWEFCDRYPKVEVALSAPVYEGVEPISTPKDKVRILAILGNSTGIDTRTDRLLLEQLPDAEIGFLIEPQRQELNEALWRHRWDILFFAGHSSSQGNGETGRIHLNQTDSLTLDQLRYALRKAIARGLSIAIFNSCDGLGLARDLADLKIPEIVVMREPVPDRVAQEFLKYFLEAFARGESFYLAVREARERLQGWEDRFPCATWLPLICQNPAAIPPTWQGLGGGSSEEPVPTEPVVNVTPPPRISRRKPGLVKVGLLSLAIAASVLGLRQLGVLEPLELRAFDHLMQQRPAELPDSRLLVVEVTEADIQAQGEEPRRGSLSDRSLARLLEILESHGPRAIGLDIYRDFPVREEYPELAKRLATSDRLIPVCKVSNQEDPGIAPPPEVPEGRLGFADVVTDADGLLRRHLLALTPPPASSCSAFYSLSTQLAFRYLAAEGISPEFTPQGHLRLDNTVFKTLNAGSGGYHNIDPWGHQILLNYRSHRSPQDFVAQATLTEVLQGQLNPEAVRDRIVLIGVTARSANDYFFTPYSREQRFYPDMPGVIVQAQMVSQILSAVLDGRPLLWVWSTWGEVLWICGWSLVGGLLSMRFPLRWRLILVGGAFGILYGFCFSLLLQGGWVPLVPAALALVSTSGCAIAYRTLPTQRHSSTLKS